MQPISQTLDELQTPFENSSGRSPSVTSSTATIEARARAQIEREYARSLEVSPGSDTCPFCDGMGFVGVNVPFGHALFGKTFPCPCGAGQQRTWAALRNRFNNPGVPDKFADYTFDTFLARCAQFEEADEGKQEAYRAARRFVVKRLLVDKGGTPKYWLILSGEPGVGKSGLMAAMTHAMYAQDLPVLWQDANAIVEAIKTSYDEQKQSAKKNPTRADILDAAQQVPILCIDDMGDPDDDEPVTKHERTIFYEILRERHLARRLTVITTNLDEAAFLRTWGKRINRRVHEAGLWMPMAGVDLSEK